MAAGTDYCKPSTGECVPCLEDVHCTTDDAAACNTTTNECEPCTENPDCDGVMGIDVCDDGACVQCTPEQEDACVGKVCSALTNTCTSATPGSATVCEACEADSQCRAGQLCVEQLFTDQDSMTHSIGHYCFAEQQVGTCSTAPATYREPLAATSVEGVSAIVCNLDNTTCPARNDYGKDCTSEAECGASGIVDGMCELKEGYTVTLCTYFCDGHLDCPTGNLCNMIEGFCRP